MAKVVTKFIRKRNANTALTQNKLSARVQVSGANLTFSFKKTANASQAGFYYLRPTSGYYRRPPGGIDRYNRPESGIMEFTSPTGDVYISQSGDQYIAP